MTIPFVTGSDTSEAAAHSKIGSAGSDQARVYQFVRDRGPMGATDAEVETALVMLHQNASARRNALVRQGVLCDSGLRRKTPSGRLATVWVVGAGTPIEGASIARTTRPSDAQIRSALGELAAVVALAQTTGGPTASEDLGRVQAWLEAISRAS